MKGTDVNANTVNTILLKITIINELVMYNTIEGQCMSLWRPLANKYESTGNSLGFFHEREQRAVVLVSVLNIFP